MQVWPFACADRTDIQGRFIFSTASCFLDLQKALIRLVRILRKNWLLSLMICKVKKTMRYQNQIMLISCESMVPYQSPVIKRGSCRNRLFVLPMIQKQQLTTVLNMKTSMGKMQKQATFDSKDEQMAGRIIKPQMMVKIIARTKSCFILNFQLKDITAQQQMMMEGQVKKARFMKQLAKMMGIARSMMRFDDFQGSIEAVKATVMMIQKQGKLASWMKYRIAKVKIQAITISIEKDLKLNLQGIFLITYYSLFFYYSFTSIFSSFYAENSATYTGAFYFLALSYSLLKDLAESLLLLWKERCDYFLRFVFMISYMTFLCQVADCGSKNLIYISLTLDYSSQILLVSLFVYRNVTSFFMYNAIVMSQLSDNNKMRKL